MFRIFDFLSTFPFESTYDFAKVCCLPRLESFLKIPRKSFVCLLHSKKIFENFPKEFKPWNFTFKCPNFLHRSPYKNLSKFYIQIRRFCDLISVQNLLTTVYIRCRDSLNGKENRNPIKNNKKQKTIFLQMDNPTLKFN